MPQYSGGMEIKMERLKKTGKLEYKKSADIKKSRIGIGFEKLDRDVFDPTKAYDKLAAVGIKYVRLQSGWAKTEKQKGVYDFAWLDEIVDNLISRGFIPWICLCYGNALYNEEAKESFGAVGYPPIYTEEAKKAWDNYVTALVTRYRDKVGIYEVWNEPDGVECYCWKYGTNAKDLGEFTIATSKAIRKANPDTKIIGGVICVHSLTFLSDAFKTGMADYIDAVSFHEYTHDETHLFGRVSSLRGLCDMYNPNIKLVQGESGSQSRSDGAGALAGGAWTERRQAKQLLRHTVADLMTEVAFTSYFSCMDMIEALNGTIGDKASYLDYGYFGVLRADFDENGYSTGEYSEKPSYYALGNLCAIFTGEYEVKPVPIMLMKKPSPRIFGTDDTENITSAGFVRKDGSCAFAYWKSTNLMTNEYESTVSIHYADIKGAVRLIDPYDGSVYEIPESMTEREGTSAVTFNNLPLKDYPLILTFGEFVEE